MSEIPNSLIDHLILLLTPPENQGRRPIYFSDIHQIPWKSIETNSLAGLISRGTPNEIEIEEINRILLPGGHFILISPEESPIGWEGAIALENGGMEIRDSILVVENSSDPFHYIPKVSRREREAGCSNLPGISGAKAVNRKKGSAGLSNPRAGASRTSREVKNFHETVKPKKLMEKILQDVPPGLVVDPFMGSGSTALACLSTGHDFVGIEKNEKYLRIADARVKYWEREIAGWKNTRIDSESPTEERDSEENPFFEVFGKCL